jgi:hypothetical protein
MKIAWYDKKAYVPADLQNGMIIEAGESSPITRCGDDTARVYGYIIGRCTSMDIADIAKGELFADEVLCDKGMETTRVSPRNLNRWLCTRAGNIPHLYVIGRIDDIIQADNILCGGFDARYFEDSAVFLSPQQREELRKRIFERFIKYQKVYQ